MGSTIFTLALALAATGQYATHPLRPGGRILAPMPGNGAGFPNGNPDGYGWFDFGTALPIGGDRIAEYYFPRYNSVPPSQMFLPSYYNPYVTRGQRYVSYTGCGGDHPAGGPPLASAALPVHPYQASVGSGPRVNVPPFTGRVEAPAINAGGTGLTP